MLADVTFPSLGPLLDLDSISAFMALALVNPACLLCSSNMIAFAIASQIPPKNIKQINFSKGENGSLKSNSIDDSRKYMFVHATQKNTND